MASIVYEVLNMFALTQEGKFMSHIFIVTGRIAIRIGILIGFNRRSVFAWQFARVIYATVILGGLLYFVGVHLRPDLYEERNPLTALPLLSVCVVISILLSFPSVRVYFKGTKGTAESNKE